MGTDQEQLETRILSAGDVYRVPPGTIHRVLAVDDALVLEVCTPGDDDIIRLEDDYGRRRRARPRAVRHALGAGAAPPTAVRPADHLGGDRPGRSGLSSARSPSSLSRASSRSRS